jgi:long-chain fatty acid transport protein
MPQLGFKKKINQKIDASLSVYAFSGINTDWPRNNTSFGDPGRMGIDYSQILAVPSMSYKLNSMHALGIAPMLGFQRIRLRGLQNFQSSSIVDPSKVTNNGYSYAYGVGVRVGWQGKFNECMQGGLTYSTKTHMTKFNKYKGLLAGGRIDVPSVISAGLKFNTNKDLILATDYERIQYRNIPALHNPFGNPFNFGDKNSGAGFGWRNISVYKFGAEYLYNHCNKIKAGISMSRKPYDNTQMDFNIIAPAVTQWHFMLGFAHKLHDKSELSFVYMHAFKTKLTGNSRLGGTSNLGTVQHSMYQHLLGVAYEWK